MDPTWMVRLDAPGNRPRLAVKDCIDVEGLPTTAGCQVIAEQEELGQESHATDPQGAPFVATSWPTSFCSPAGCRLPPNG
jgi:hypothetical protein